MIVIDNVSSDNTVDIIKAFIAEGLPIHLAERGDPSTPLSRLNLYTVIDMAVDVLGADLVVPLDADEFLYHTDGINPREALEALDEKTEYTAFWRNYIYESEPDIAKGCMPNNFTHYRNERLECSKWLHKAIASRYLIKEWGAGFCPGTHFLEYPDAQQPVNKVIHDKLVFAHFPIRSHAQIIRKGLTFWLNHLPQFDYTHEDKGIVQYGILFEELVRHGEISQENMKRHCIEYTLVQVLGIEEVLRMQSEAAYADIKADNSMVQALGGKRIEQLWRELGDSITVYGPMDTSFCADRLKLRYTHEYNGFNRSFWRAVAGEIDTTVTTFADRAYKQTRLAREAAQQRDEYLREIEDLKRTIADIYSSRTYKAAAIFKRLYRAVVPFRR